MASAFASAVALTPEPFSRGSNRFVRRVKLAAGGLALLAAAGGAWGAEKAWLNQTNVLPTLTNAAQILQLTPDQAASRYPVRLRGVITFADAKARYGFIQDDTAGTVVFWTNTTPPAQPGQLVELEGVTESNVYAPSILLPVFHVLGDGRYPRPLRASYTDLNAGHADCQWAEIEGVVRSATTNSDFLFLTIALNRGSTKVSVCITNLVDPEKWVDMRVRVDGVGIGSFNGKSQFVGAELVVPSLDQITVLQAARSDPYSLPVTSLGTLGHKAEQTPGTRIHVQGVVTLFQPAKALYVRDHNDSIEVRTAQNSGAQPGDVVDVIGFYERTGGALVIEDANFRRLSSGPTPKPFEATIEQIENGRFDAELITLKATLVEWRHGASERAMSLQGDQKTIFTAWVDGGRVAGEQSPGSVVQITGVCQVTMDQDANVRSFDLRTRSAGDVVLLESPAWWTTRHALWLLGGLAGAVCLSLTWAGLLRNQIRRRTRELHGEIDEHKRTGERLAAEIAERKRMELQIEKTHKDLLLSSRRAGMAEVATSVLHNVGNVLNSVNVACSVVSQRVRSSKVGNIGKAAALLQEHEGDLPGFFATNPKGRQLPGYLNNLAGHLNREQSEILRELKALGANIEHVKEIVAVQQSYGRVSGLHEKLLVTDLVEDALRMNIASLERHSVRVEREFAPVPPILSDKHKILQILVNLIRNAKHALDDLERPGKQITLRVGPGAAGCVKVEVADNGVGISAENLTRIFGHGFTTRKDGHGFGLHSGALAAREMGGSLKVHSDGPGLGALFTLELPVQPTEAPNRAEKTVRGVEPAAKAAGAEAAVR